MTTLRSARRPKVSASPDILPHLPLDRRVSAPLHQQIYAGLRGAILGGSLRAGQRVPSTRALADQLTVSRFPVLAAYEQLLHEGYLEGRAGSGTFVSASLPDDALRSRPESADPVLATPRGRATRATVLRRDEGGLRPFRVSLPALDAFPQPLWSRLVARHARALSSAQMAYGDPAGLPTLRSAIAEHLRTTRAVRCEGEQVLIVSGSQAALRLCAAVLLSPGDRVAVEEPGYLGARAALTAGGARLAPVSVDDEGISVSTLEALGRRVAAVYTTPSHQYPLGVSMSASRRMALLNWAERRQAWVIEDDYDSEYRYVSRPLGALQGMDRHGRVIYLGTFSKVLFPAIRVGYLVVPPALWLSFLEAREALDLFSPTLYQLALVDFIREGHFLRHLRRMRTLYLARRDALLDGLARHCDGLLMVRNADAGIHVSTMLPPGIDDHDVVRRMSARGLTATPLSSSYLGDVRASGLLLGFGGWDDRRIAAATKALGATLDA